MAEIFPREHYQTARQFGVDHFSDAWGMTTAELALTLPKVEGAEGEFGLSLPVLQGYHFLHYGADPEIVKDAVDISVERKYEWDSVSTLHAVLPRMLEKQQLTRSLPLGRVAVLGSTEIDPSLSRFVDLVKIERDGSNGPAGSQRFGEFLYPKRGAVMRYWGRSAIDMFNENPDGYLKKRGPYQQVLEGLSFNVDAFDASYNGLKSRFLALSYDEREVPILKKIILTPG